MLAFPAVLAVLAAPPAPVGTPIGGQTARQAAEAELRRAEYHRDDASLLTRFLDWLGGKFSSLGSPNPSGYATLLVILLLAGLIVFAIVRAGRLQRSARSASTPDDPLAPQPGIDHRRLAAELHAQGRLAESLREWLRATVRTIEDRGVLDPRPGRTGASIAREAGSALPDIAELIQAAVTAFDAVWFGQRAATEADVALARHLAEQVRSARIDRAVEVTSYAVPQ